MSQQFIDGNNMVEVKEKNVLKDILTEFWMFNRDPRLLAIVLDAVKKGMISIDVSNLTKKDWDSTLYIKLLTKDAKQLMCIMGPLVTSTHPHELSLHGDVVRIWWD